MSAQGSKVLNIYSALDRTCELSQVANKEKYVLLASSVAAKLIPTILGVFNKTYPNVEVSLIDDNAAGVEARLLSGEVDLALGLRHSTKVDQTTPLLSDPIGVVCLKDNPIAIDRQEIDWQSMVNLLYDGTCSLLESTPARVLVKKHCIRWKTLLLCIQF